MNVPKLVFDSDELVRYLNIAFSKVNAGVFASYKRGNLTIEENNLFGVHQSSVSQHNFLYNRKKGAAKRRLLFSSY